MQWECDCSLSMEALTPQRKVKLLWTEITLPVNERIHTEFQQRSCISAAFTAQVDLLQLLIGEKEPARFHALRTLCIPTISLPHQCFLTDELFLKIHSVSKKNSFDLEGLLVHLFCCYFPWVIRAPFCCNDHYLQQLQGEKFCPSRCCRNSPQVFEACFIYLKVIHNSVCSQVNEE